MLLPVYRNIVRSIYMCVGHNTYNTQTVLQQNMVAESAIP